MCKNSPLSNADSFGTDLLRSVNEFTKFNDKSTSFVLLQFLINFK